MFDLKKELQNLPDEPGVYLMHNKEGNVIYVGKAKILKNRVRQYFKNSKNHTPKVRAMVSHVAYFEYIVTDSETEALVLECNLIKKYRPKYNVLLKDDKQYPYLKVTMNEQYPKILKTRTLKNDGAKYFGPYMGVNTIKNTLEIIQKIFKPPTCNRKFPQDIKKGRPCLNYHIKNCFAPCMGGVSEEEYRGIFCQICDFLDGDHKKLLNDLKKEMSEAAEKMDYEKAASIRDRIKAVEAISQKQKIINSDAQNDMDVIAVARSEKNAFCEIFFVRGGKVSGRENYRIEQAEDVEDAELMGEFVKQFYAEKSDFPVLILTELEIYDKNTVSDWLSSKKGRRVEIMTPKRGEKKKLMQMVKKNAELALGNYKISKLKEDEKNKSLDELSKRLGLSSKLARIEAYDISNISGEHNVATMVVFENGRPSNSKYRKFKIKSVEGSDDYASMQETLYRRFLHAAEEEEKIKKGELLMENAKFLPHPDLILIDGGRGHLNAVKEIFDLMEIEIPVFGMVKDNRHKTRGLVSDKGEVELSKVSGAFHLVTRIQDEAHRSAISYYRKLHKNESIRSELDNISGIGDVRKNALLSHFKSTEAIKDATIEELSLLKGMNRVSAQAVWSYFHKE